MAAVNYAEAEKLARGRLRIALGARQKVEAAVKRTEAEIVSLQAHELRLEAEIVEGLEAEKGVEKLRKEQRKFHDRKEDLERVRPGLERRLEAAVVVARESAVKLQVATRRNLQDRGVGRAEVIRNALDQIRDAFDSWKLLKEEDRGAKDVLRSIAPDQVSATPDFDWKTVIDSNFQSAIDEVLVAAQKAEEAIVRRSNDQAVER